VNKRCGLDLWEEIEKFVSDIENSLNIFKIPELTGSKTPPQKSIGRYK
jgi:hypothetical protein